METMVRWSSSLRGQEQNKKDLQTGAWLPLGYKGDVSFYSESVGDILLTFTWRTSGMNGNNKKLAGMKS